MPGKKSKKDDNGADRTCDFCGRPGGKAGRLFGGSNAVICEICVDLCYDALTEHKKIVKPADFEMPPDMADDWLNWTDRFESRSMHYRWDLEAWKNDFHLWDEMFDDIQDYY